MIGPLEYIAGGIAVISIAVAGYQTVRAERADSKLTKAVADTERAIGALQTCSYRLENIAEAERSNAEVPDDLLEFDVPPEWMRGTDGTDPASD